MISILLSLFLVWKDPSGHVGPKPVEVYIFLACECPISQKYVPVLNSIYATYKDAPGFEWSFVVPGKVKKSELSAFIKEFDIQFPLTVVGNPTVKKLHADTTPQVIIVKDSVVYSGAIDNWFYELGRHRRDVTENYLVDALQALKVGGVPAVTKTEAIGCPIGMSK